ncbi:MAG: hypothetical protein ACFFBI_09135, partial [Promethearchaeota archaeon]
KISNEFFKNVKNEIVGLLKSLDRENFPAINSFLYKIPNDYIDFISEFIKESIHDYDQYKAVN